jgi:flavin reductase (DIM6/NTAB) family NADH-FMN oxidoreductase RutF
MDEQAKKTALRMISYGLYVLGTRQGDTLNGAAINWLTQASFQPPLIAMGIKRDSDAFTHLKEGDGQFAVSVLEVGQKDVAFAFFKPTTLDGSKLNGYDYERLESGAPVLIDAAAWFEGKVTDIVERGDHAVIVGEVTNAGVRREAKPLTLAECGVFYGG